uniref:Adenosine deaminase n=1 Tax=Phallusia mammillata TaxID=59560 RepID=A0A6F9D632_9ASCI|nr:adenosine deaminase-like [Phallusia mammillata]
MLYAKTKGNVRPRDVIEAVCSTTSEASVKFGIEVRIILCTISLLPEWSMEVAKMCKEYSSMGVVGIDIAGEGTEPGNLVQQRHIDAYQFCRDHNIHRTAHAGENGSAEEVEQAMQILNAQRIGHGYHVVDSESVYNEAKARDVHFEVCPRSSYLTASVDPDLTKHPAIRFLKDKVNFSLSTDDPAIQQTTIYDDYNIAQKYFGFSIEDIKLLNILALKSAFVEESVKNELIRKFETEYAKIT